MQSAEEKPVKQIQSIHRALDIMELLIDVGDGMRLTEIAAGTGLNKTTAFHIIKTLESRGYIEQSPDSLRYKSGWRQFVNGQQIYKGMNLTLLCGDIMRELNARYNETVELYIYVKSGNSSKGLCSEVVHSTRHVQITTHTGKLVPLSCTAVGKIYLSALPLKDALDILHDERPLLPEEAANGASDNRFLQDLDFIRKHGYCLVAEEYEEGVSSLAVGFYKYSGRAVGALQISLPTGRATEATTAAMIDDLLVVSRKITAYPL